MTVNVSDITAGPYLGNNTASQFSYDFKVSNKSQLTVFETDDSGIVTTLVVDTDYTVNDVGVDGGGTIDRIAGNLPTDYLWYIRSNYANTQDTDFSSQGGFFPAIHTSAFDLRTFISLQQQDLINRAVRLPDSYSGSAVLTLPAPEAGKTILWSLDGLSMVNGPSIGTFAEYATNTQLSEWNAEAVALTADSYATQLEDVFVVSYASDGDGTFTATPTAEYSALHYASKASSAVITDTGVTSSYTSSVVVGGTTFNQPAVLGEINGDEGRFTVTYAGATGITIANLSAASTYVYIDNTGDLQQQTTTPTRQDWSRKIFTIRVAVNTVTNVILGFEYLNNPVGNYANSIRDVYTYLLAQGVPFKKDQAIIGRGADLGFDVSDGTLLEFGGTGDINNANILSLDAVSNVSYTLTSRTAFVSTETNLVKFWDNAGTITALGSTTVVGHRLYRFSNGNFAMQYGQGNYANMALAKSGALLEEYDLNPALKNATFFGWWFIQETATNTGGTTLTEFKEYTIGIQGGTSNGLAGAVLRGNNGSDFLDIDATKANLGLEVGVDVLAPDGDGSGLTGVGGVTIASQATVNTGTNDTETVTPLKFSNAVTTAKAWVNFNGDGAVAIRSSYNVSSITDNGTGEYAVNFTTALSDDDYAPCVSCRGSGSTRALGSLGNSSSSATTTQLDIRTYNEGGPSTLDSDLVSVHVLGN
jgi:hypothetical protein